MNVSRMSKLLLAISIVILIGNALIISRDYQDSWILEGLEIPFVFFVISYAVAFFSERSLSRMVMLAVIGRTMFLLIPNLKYRWFQGPYIDQHLQYALANNVYSKGHISSEQTFGQAYTATPLMHLLFSTFSIILNVPVVYPMKYLPVLFSSIYPLLIYIVVEKMEFSEATTILKYALFISSIPFTWEQYVVEGTLFGILLAFLILSALTLIFQKSDRRYWVVCTVFIFALTAAHSITSMILTVSLLAIMALQRVSYFRPKSYLRAPVAFAFASMNAAWLVFLGGFTLQQILSLIFVAMPSGTTPLTESLPATFFEHIRVNIFSAIKSFSIAFGADALFLILTFAGLVILLKRRKRLNSATNFLFIFGWLVFFLMIIGLLLKLGPTRAMHFARLLFPVFSGVFIVYMSRNARVRKWIRSVIFLLVILMMVLATIELYRCQPLAPSANVLYKDLPPDVPLGYVGLVNSIYQRHMINFAENHIGGTIAADSVTRSQIVGLTEISFSAANLVRYYPLDENQPEQRYDYFLIHLPGKSGSLVEKPQSRTQSLILEAILNSSVVYTNGESFILTDNYPK